MTILSRYIFKEVSKIFLMCFAGLMTIYLVIDFFEKVRRFLKHDAELYDILMFFVYISPGIAFQMAPVAVLMATVLAMGLLSRNNEITAMRAAGISLFRMALPFLGFATLVSVGLFIISAVLAPLGNLRAEYIKAVHVEQKNPTTMFQSERAWLQIGNQTLMNYQTVESAGSVLKGVSLYHLAQDFALTEFIEAKEIHYDPPGWTLHQGFQRTLFPDGTFKAIPFDRKKIDIHQIPEDFQTWLSFKSKEMTLVDLKAYAIRLQRDGYNFARYLTDYYGRVAFPFVSLVMALVGMALSLKGAGSRGGGMAVGIGQALMIAFLYWTIHSVALALGRSGALMPVLAGWFANIVFLSFGMYLFLKIRY